MKSFAEYERELQNSPKGESLRALAESEEGRRLSSMLDAQAVESAAKSGDTQALKSILSQVLSTKEGQSLAKKLAQAMKKD